MRAPVDVEHGTSTVLGWEAAVMQRDTLRYMARKRGQISIRVAQDVLDRLREHARLRGEGHTKLAERYLEEGLKMDEHPGIHFVDGPAGRRASVIGTADVWELVEVLKANDWSVEETAAYLEIPPHLVEAALRYYGDNREEIDAWIARNDEIAEREEARWRAMYEAKTG